MILSKQELLKKSIIILNKNKRLTSREEYRMMCYLEQYSTMSSLGAAIFLISLFHFNIYDLQQKHSPHLQRMKKFKHSNSQSS